MIEPVKTRQKAGVMKPWVSIVLVTVLGACAGACSDIVIPDSTALVDGAPVVPPPGWVGYCLRHTEDSGCRS
jgi:hypothetical protein